MREYKPSDFANIGQPMCSRWGKSEIECLALAYVQALTSDGDTWKKLSREQVRDLLTDEQRRPVRFMLKDDYYQRWFDMVSEQICDSAGALGVRGFWNEFQLTRASQGERVSPCATAICDHDIYSRGTTMLSKDQAGKLYGCRHCEFQASTETNRR